MSEDIWFSRLTLKRDDAAVAPLLRDLVPAEAGAAMAISHRLMWTLMPEATRAQFDQQNSEKRDGAAFLWREAEAGRKFYLLGPRPNAASPYFQVESKVYAPAFRPGDRFTFQLRVNATVARKNGDAKSRRADVAMDRMRQAETEAAATGEAIGARAERRLKEAESAVGDWLGRIGERDGFELPGLRLAAYRPQILPRAGKRATIGVSDVEGLLEVVDGERFLARVLTGFGRAKAFGCGLMLLRRAS